VSDTYLKRLAARSSLVASVLCVGIDPHPERLPDGFSRDLAGVDRFATMILEAAAPFAAAIKPNLAFFESFGSAGMAALERLRARVPSGLPVVADAKRGDISSTAARHAAALFDCLGADAVTINPYPGGEGLEPLLARADRFAYVLCRTSNPGSAEFQDLLVEADASIEAPPEALYLRVARRVATWGPGGTVGLVVGATAPGELRAIRSAVPDLAFLVPGVGAQGGDLDVVLAGGPVTGGPSVERPGRGLLVSVSRGIADAALEAPSGASTDLEARLASAARDWAARLPVLP
jgi:orotidine 5'-phosphate decarboxylase subfamily 2